MAANMHISGAGKHHAPTTSVSDVRKASNLDLTIARFGGKMLGKVHSAVKALQMARTMSTLSNMSDNKLKQIGIYRSDIPKYAEAIMAIE